MYEINYYDGKGWVKISEEHLRDILKDNYRNIDTILRAAFETGKEYRTSPFSYFRYKKEA